LVREGKETSQPRKLGEGGNEKRVHVLNTQYSGGWLSKIAQQQKTGEREESHDGLVQNKP